MRSSEQTVKGPADLSKLRSNVVQFCGGLPIYELEILEKDGITVLHGEPFPKYALIYINIGKMAQLLKDSSNPIALLN